MKGETDDDEKNKSGPILREEIGESTAAYEEIKRDKQLY